MKQKTTPIQPIEEEAQQEENETALKIEKLEDQLKRAVADYQNLQRRVEEEKKEVMKYANKELFTNLLPAFDTLFLAGKYTEDQSVKLTIQRIMEILKENGIERIDVDNVKFNPETMEAIDVVQGESEMVVEEVRPGFSLYGKLIRPSQVKVGGKDLVN